MPEWVYWVGWLAVPVAGVAVSMWWHERESHRALDAYLTELMGTYNDQRIMNTQLRREIARLQRENTDLRQVARSNGHIPVDMTELAAEWAAES